MKFVRQTIFYSMLRVFLFGWECYKSDVNSEWKYFRRICFSYWPLLSLSNDLQIDKWELIFLLFKTKNQSIKIKYLDEVFCWWRFFERREVETKWNFLKFVTNIIQSKKISFELRNFYCFSSLVDRNKFHWLRIQHETEIIFW